MTEHQKLGEVQKESQAIGAFLEWLSAQGYVISNWVDEGDVTEGERLHPAYGSITEMLAKYFEIDLNKLEEEKRQMLEEIRGNSKT